MVSKNSLLSTKKDTVSIKNTSVKKIPLQSFDGSNNNLSNPNLGQANTAYSRELPAQYADGVGQPIEGPNTRYISNRIFQDFFVNVPDQHGLSQYGFSWGQFIDHDLGLAQTGKEPANIAFDRNDPLEYFKNDLGIIKFTRDQPIAGTGVDGKPREFTNTVSAYIDGSNVYGTDAPVNGVSRVERLRDPQNRAKLLVQTVNGQDYLPLASQVGITDMERDGRLRIDPTQTRAAGDVRANEFLGLTALQTLFLREHNRIVDLLDTNPKTAKLSADEKFQIARRIVIAEEQAITYKEFLPSLGLDLASYNGYKPKVSPQISNEFAVVGYRAHSQIHGDVVAIIEPGKATPEYLDRLAVQGVKVTAQPDGSTKLQVPTNVAFFNPALMESLGLNNIARGLHSGPQYRNDEQIDNQLRSLLFQLPNQNFDPNALDGPGSAKQFSGVVDLGAIDIERARDHGIASYNDLREAYGLARVKSFTEITGEATDELPEGTSINDPSIINWLDASRTEIAPADAAGKLNPVDATLPPPLRNSTVAARLKAIYGSVDKIDAFVGMVAEKHLPHASFGQLQKAIWEDQFSRVRDGDRFFYENLAKDGIFTQDKEGKFYLEGVPVIESLSDLITANTSVNKSELAQNVFFLKGKVIEGTDKFDRLSGTDKNDRLLGFGGNDTLRGGKGNDILDGGRGNDWLLGEAGNDKLIGAEGNDYLLGGNGEDILWGGKGQDILLGGSGKDIFVLAEGEGKDKIIDFKRGVDKVALMGSLTFDQLGFRGNNIFVASTGEILAQVSGVNTSHLTSADFTRI
jgi:hypothetical protein